MDFSLSEEQEILRKTSRNFLTDKCPKKLIREMEKDEKGYSPELWQEMAQLGWMGILIPERYNGSNNTFMELAFLLEEMGRVCLPGPFVPTVVLGGLPILNAGTDEQKERYLQQIAEGKTIFTMALTEEDADYNPGSIQVTAKVEKNDFILNGTKLFVPYAHIANHMLCITRTSASKNANEGITIFIVDTQTPGVQLKLLNTFTTNNKLCEVVFKDVRVSKNNILGRQNKGWEEVQRALEQAAIAKCCEMVGGMGAVLEMTVNYAKQRVQFGRPIGSFQAIQHHCANLLVDVETSKVITYEAVWKLSKGLACSTEIAMAKAWVNEAYRRVVILATQIHGGVGIMEDHDMPRYMKHAKSAEIAFGDSRFHRKKVAQELDSIKMLNAEIAG